MRANGWLIHVYMEGPGGPTGSSWSPDECQRVQAGARIYVSALMAASPHAALADYMISEEGLRNQWCDLRQRFACPGLR